MKPRTKWTTAITGGILAVSASALAPAAFPHQPSGRVNGSALPATSSESTSGPRGSAASAAASPVRLQPPRPGALARALAGIRAHNSEVRDDRGQKFRATTVTVDPDGTSHTHLTRTFDGLPVLGGDVIVHQARNGAWRGSSLTLAGPPAKTSPALSSAKAQSKAAATGGTIRGGAHLVYEARTPDGKPRLAWRFLTTGTQPDGTPSRAYVTVDARTGAILTREETVQTDAADGRSLYSGKVPLRTTRSGGAFRLSDPTRGNTYTGDARNDTDLCLGQLCFHRAPATVFTDPDDHWGDGTTGDRATAAVDAQYGTDMTWDFYKNVLGRSGIAGDGKGSFNRVHYGTGYANAFWDDSCFCMTYGDGDGKQTGPMVGLDVAGHEMTHGVTSRTADLTYSGESGGLNEATSDIIGTAVEWYARNPHDPGDYLIGEKVVRPGFGQPALRYMDRPSKDGRSADYWSSKTAGLDPHLSSGVANHFFYLLAEGSGPKTIDGVHYKSPTYDDATITGIGRDAAIKIWYRALTTYMTSSTDYAAARTATLHAAKDLYGTRSKQYTTVAAAWTAVNVR
ncbi:M4 family metallopeptidase [Actinomadura sp. NPDC049382]|uniref:M4 family metallopeptidase n=1 Tax=Actinomadura sp. NPDC049382 TaxID=3158220 RepID=UPI00341BD704